MNKERIVAGAGLTSLSIGGIGTTLAGMGFCACFWAPALSVLGAISIITGIRTKYSTVFLVFGMMLMTISVILHRRKKLCPVHGKEHKKH